MLFGVFNLQRRTGERDGGMLLVTEPIESLKNDKLTHCQSDDQKGNFFSKIERMALGCGSKSSNDYEI